MKLVFLTGSSRGIGKALHDCLLDQGFQVVAFARPTFDFSKRSDIEKASKRILETPLKELEIACLVNNAATEQPIVSLEDLDAEDLSSSLNVNVVAPTILSGAFLRLTESSVVSRKILNISSGLAVRSLLGSGAYCLGKSALEMLTRQIAEEQKEKPNPAVAVSLRPGVVDTAMQERLRGGSNKMPSQDFFARLKSENQLVSPVAVAEATYRDIIQAQVTSGLAYRLEGGAYKIVSP